MSDWRADHRRELIEKQRHISQKLAQLREFRRVALEWERDLRRLHQWFSGLETAAGSSKWFSVGSLIRMNSITGSLQQMVSAFEQVGDPKTAGTGTTVTSSGTQGSSGSATPDAGQVADWLTSRAGPLASSAPWELIPSFAPAVAESVRQGEYGAAAAEAIFSPFTSLTAVGFAEETLDLSVELIEEHESEFDDLEQGWKDARDGLGRIVDALDAVDHQALRALETELAETLRDYERTYDGALGADERSASELRAQAEKPGRHVSDAELDEWEAALNERTAELDAMLEEGNEPFDPSTVDLPGFDD